MVLVVISGVVEMQVLVTTTQKIHMIVTKKKVDVNIGVVVILTMSVGNVQMILLTLVVRDVQTHQLKIIIHYLYGMMVHVFIKLYQ